MTFYYTNRVSCISSPASSSTSSSLTSTETVLTTQRYDKSFTKGRALFSGLGSTPAMARTHLERLLFVQVFFPATLQSFPNGPQDAAHRSPAPQVEHPLHALDPSARIHRLPFVVATLPPAPHKYPSMFPPVPPSLLLPFPSWSRGTETVLTSLRYDKSFTKGRVLFSGHSSTPATARTHLQRLLFVQVKKVLFSVFQAYQIRCFASAAEPQLLLRNCL
ncbi:hypothetical protein HPB51_003043 [Rhipicephalus microplus]|uniref:Uncharacterized protein n=1 Tax=Rhipicephalus microplus TaxID=6941 RepID=A0A9J6EL27_RHIMP|nr:hypothetical protein HPB51_003043 [Rhipicephalus microplus]